MPNWCANSATIFFDEVNQADDFNTRLCVMEINENAKDENGNDLSVLGYFVPEPKYDDSDEGMPGWYMWRVENWGTKWDIVLHNKEWIDDKTIVLHFDTAWSPPIAVYRAIEEEGYVVEATYYEPGMCYVGSYSNEYDHCIEYADCETPEEIREKIGEELDDEWGISEDFRMYMEENETEEFDEDRLDNDSGVENYG